MTVKKQYKYATVKVNINLFKSKEKQFKEGRWSTYTQIFSRQFPAEWTLKQRQERDRFQGIREMEVENEDVTEWRVYIRFLRNMQLLIIKQ